MSCFDLTHAPVATTARAAAAGLVSMSTRPDPEGSGTVENALSTAVNTSHGTKEFGVLAYFGDWALVNGERSLGQSAARTSVWALLSFAFSLSSALCMHE